MRYETRNKIIIIVVLLSIMGITIGFAAFTANLTISSNVSVNPNASAFKVVFSKSSTSVDTSNITPTVTPTTINASNGVIDNTNSPTLTNLTANFTEPGQKAVYSLYVYNAGEYTAYLNSVTLKGSKTCTPETGTTASLVTAACEDIKVTVKVGSDSYTETTQNITGKSIEAKGSTPVEVTIEYLSGGDRADGPFSVEFNDISLFYATITGQNEPEEESGTLYTGIIYSNSKHMISNGVPILADVGQWCIVKPAEYISFNTCASNNYFGDPISLESEEECEVVLEELTSDPEYTFFLDATCDEWPLRDITNIDTDVYIKHEVVNNIITTSYACAKYTENGIRKEVCLKGEDPAYFERNTATLKGVESYFNTLSYSESDTGKGYCTFRASDSYCDSDSLHLYAGSDGYVDSYDGSLHCDVTSDGDSRCYG